TPMRITVPGWHSTLTVPVTVTAALSRTSALLINVRWGAGAVSAVLMHREQAGPGITPGPVLVPVAAPVVRSVHPAHRPAIITAAVPAPTGAQVLFMTWVPWCVTTTVTSARRMLTRVTTP